MRNQRLSRRQALGRAGAVVAGSLTTAGVAALQGPADRAPAAAAPPRIPVPPVLVPRADLVNVLEYEEQARRVLSATVQDLVTGSDRSGFDHITLRPRMLVPTVDLDLTLRLYGDTHFAPILVGPVSHQRQYHPDGELATLAGAAAARAAMVISSESDTPLADLTAKATGPVWYQIFADDTRAGAATEDAARARCTAVCVTLTGAPDWRRLGALTRRSPLPLVLKGVITPADATRALDTGFQGIVVSEYGAARSAAATPLILRLAAIVDAVTGRMPVLADGGFRRGTDILKALAFGATAVLVGRPVIWGLAAYGAPGVEGVMRMLQTELARYMVMCGKPSLAVLDRTLVRVHEPRSPGTPATVRSGADPVRP